MKHSNTSIFHKRISEVRNKSNGQPVLLIFIFKLFIWSVALNYPWEMLQMPLYKAMSFSDPLSWLICFKASLGDGVIIVMIWGIGYLTFRNRSWFQIKRIMPVAVLLFSGAIFAVVIEIHAIRTGRWGYTELMPLAPYIEVGLSPLLQLITLPWLAMRIANRTAGVAGKRELS
jgi:hypothetical protein